METYWERIGFVPTEAQQAILDLALPFTNPPQHQATMPPGGGKTLLLAALATAALDPEGPLYVHPKPDVAVMLANDARRQDFLYLVRAFLEPRRLERQLRPIKTPDGRLLGAQLDAATLHFGTWGELVPERIQGWRFSWALLDDFPPDQGEAHTLARHFQVVADRMLELRREGEPT